MASRIVSWNPNVVRRPMLGAFRGAALGTVRVARGIAPRGMSAGLTFTGPWSARLKGRGPAVNIVVAGARPHEEKPSAKQAMKVGDGFAKRVRHPGVRAKPFIGQAASQFPTLFRAEGARRMRF